MELRQLKFFVQGEWMSMRIFFPGKYQNKIYAKVVDLMDLRLECSTRSMQAAV
jgi:hypothetical protein